MGGLPADAPPRRGSPEYDAVFLANRIEADFQAWRDQQAWTAEKYRRFDRGERMPSDGNRQRASADRSSLLLVPASRFFPRPIR
jgi:hypothetical protein